MAKIGVKTFTTTIKNKVIGRKIVKTRNTSKKRKNNVDYGEAITFVLALSLSSHDDAWYIDFKTSMHLSHKQEWFKDFEKIPPMKIYLENNSIQEVVGRGKMMASLKLKDKTTPTYFKNILYAPGLAKKEFSVKQIVSMGHMIKFVGLCCVIKN